MAFWVHHAASRAPERVALETPERALTWAELSGEAAAGARHLAALGAGPGVRVALAPPPGADFVIALHACMLAGAPVVPIDLRHSPEERARRMAGAAVLVDEPLGGRRLRGVGDLSPGVGQTSHTPGDGMPLALSPGPDATDHTLAVMHTSGTTSDPKPIELTHGNFLASALGSAVMLGLDQEERWLCPMPLTHVGGLSIAIRSAIYATTTVLHGRFDTEAVLAELMEPGQRTTLVSLVPTMLARLLDAGLERPPSLRWVLLGGGPMAPALLERAAAAGVPVAPTYGMTEACSQIATFGFALPGVELATSEDREILVRGPIVSPTVERDERGFFATGDLGRFDERGRIVITGRKADTIITGGENVAPTEVEDVLLEHPAVADAGVRGRPDPEWGEAIVAFVVLRSGGTVTAAELAAHCAARIARFKIPKEFRFVEELPRTASGKLLRRELAPTV